MAAAGLTITYARSHRMVDFCYPFYNDAISLMIPYPELDSTIGIIAKPFNFEVQANNMTNTLIYNIKKP